MRRKLGTMYNAYARALCVVRVCISFHAVHMGTLGCLVSRSPGIFESWSRGHGHPSEREISISSLLRLDSSYSRVPFVKRATRHWLGGRRITRCNAFGLRRQRERVALPGSTCSLMALPSYDASISVISIDAPNISSCCVASHRLLHRDPSFSVSYTRGRRLKNSDVVVVVEV
jgi:hypothetical protein